MPSFLGESRTPLNRARFGDTLLKKRSERQTHHHRIAIIWPEHSKYRSVYNRQFVWCLLRILLLSDIHANLEALEACLAAAPSFDLVANLGDVVGYGASPNEVPSVRATWGRFSFAATTTKLQRA
jgi:hypothetical protein